MERPAGTDVTFLIVDDDHVSVMAIRRALTQLRFTNPIEVARDGQEALDRLRDPNGGVPTPYIILLDLNMPRMGGLEFLSQVRRDQELRESVVFVLTTSDAPSDVADAYRHLVAGYIVKENTFATLRDAISMLGAYVQIVRLPD